MESFFLNFGFSYTWSKLLPYILMTMIGIWIGIVLFKRSKSVLTKILSIIVIGGPFGIYFAVNPIYQGDFSNESRTVEHTVETAELNGEKLVVISLPGCVFCKESVERLKEVKKYDKNLKIEYVVTSSDSATLDFYNEVIKGEFPLRLAENPEAMTHLAQGRFPSFVLVNEKKPMKIWVNNTFGVRALDEVVNNLK